jgi:GNAT superfamily N-acetyltransferase
VIERVESDEQLREWHAVYTAVWPGPHATPEEFRRRLDTQAGRAQFVARVDGAVVGAATVTPADDLATVWVVVLPGSRRRGTGSALLDRLTDESRALGLRRLEAQTYEDMPEGIAFLEAHGFAESGRGWASELVVETAPDAAPPPGIELTTLADSPEHTEAVYAMSTNAGELAGPQRTVSLEEWTTRYLTHPEAVFVAVEDDEAVGLAWLVPLQDGEAEHGLTMVREDRRGRGIAQALKRAQIAWAYEHGFRRLTTSNDEENAPMRAVNEKLGYTPLPAEVHFRKELA